MHVLGHSFSQRRKSSKRPRDLHIRKVSFSGCSLSSGCSFSSSSSTSTFTPRAHMADGLHMNPSVHAPPRLNERPFIKTERQRYEDTATFYDDDEEDEAENERYYDEEDGVEFEMVHPDSKADQPRSMDLPPHSSPMDHTADEPEQPQDYFLLQLAKRPQLNRSHWSESTIQTLDLDLSTPGGSGYATPSEAATTPSEGPVTALAPMPPPNFSHKRLTSAPIQIQAPTPKRPPFKAADSVEAFIKRGGWKRRGIVFNGEEVSGSEDEDEDEEEHE